MIYFLAWNSEKKKLDLLVLVGDPWKEDVTLYIYKIDTEYLKFPPRSLHVLKQVHLLA